MITASVVLCGWNCASYLRECLESVLAQEPRPLEILYVDGGSTDGTSAVFEEVAKGAQGRLRWLDQGPIRGLARARNVGAEAARGEVVSFIDTDARAHPQWLSRALARFEADPDLAGLAGAGIETCASPADSFRGVYYQQWWGPRAKASVRFLFGLNSHYRRERLLRAGGFTEHFLASGEDVELGLRMNERGERLAYDPEVIVWHGRRDDWKSLEQMVDKWSYYGRLAQLTRGRSPRPAWFWPLRQVWRSLRWLLLEVPFARNRPEGWWRRPWIYWVENRAAWRSDRDWARKMRAPNG